MMGWFIELFQWFFILIAVGVAALTWFNCHRLMMMLEDEPELNDDLKELLEKRLQDVKDGKILTTEQLKERLGL